jgi:hypothetical protein
MTFKHFNSELGKSLGKTKNWTKGLNIAGTVATYGGEVATLAGAPEIGVPLMAGGQVLKKGSNLTKQFEK